METPSMKLKVTASLALVATLAAGVVMATAGGSTAPAGEAPAMQARLATRAGLVAVATAGPALVAVGDFGTVVRSVDGARPGPRPAACR